MAPNKAIGTLQQKSSELADMLWHVDDTIEILSFEKDMELRPITTGTQVPKSMMKLNNTLKMDHHDLKKGHHGKMSEFHKLPNEMNLN